MSKPPLHPSANKTVDEPPSPDSSGANTPTNHESAAYKTAETN